MPDGIRILLSRVIVKIVDGVSHLLLCVSERTAVQDILLSVSIIDLHQSRFAVSSHPLREVRRLSEHARACRRTHHPIIKAVSFLVQSFPLLELSSESDFVRMRYHQYTSLRGGWTFLSQCTSASPPTSISRSPAPSTEAYELFLFIKFCE